MDHTAQPSKPPRTVDHCSATSSPSPLDPMPSAEPATCLLRRLDWAALLQRVLSIDLTACPRCSGRLSVIAFITDTVLVDRILGHLGLPAAPPHIAPARAPPQPVFGELVARPREEASAVSSATLRSFAWAVQSSFDGQQTRRELH